MKSSTQKLFLILVMGLFLGGCDLFENKTPSETLKHMIGGKRGIHGSSNVFFISADATEYSEAFSGIELEYRDGNDFKAIYKGYVETSEDYYTYTTVTLSDLTDEGGTIHVEGYAEYTDTFKWY